MRTSSAREQDSQSPRAVQHQGRPLLRSSLRDGAFRRRVSKTVSDGSSKSTVASSLRAGRSLLSVQGDGHGTAISALRSRSYTSGETAQSAMEEGASQVPTGSVAMGHESSFLFSRSVRTASVTQYVNSQGSMHRILDRAAPFLQSHGRFAVRRLGSHSLAARIRQFDYFHSLVHYSTWKVVLWFGAMYIGSAWVFAMIYFFGTPGCGLKFAHILEAFFFRTGNPGHDWIWGARRRFCDLPQLYVYGSCPVCSCGLESDDRRSIDRCIVCQN
mmetsp:Transcript_5024/g.10996  ORF Transcript_5024/g.10996 Transcript_5024/m.10996 type:complete len:272 (+) Transcript_5024:18-833(+)